MSAIIANGVTLYASDVPVQITKIGVLLTAASGKRHWVQRMSGATPLVKRSWSLPFNGITAARRAQVEAVANLNATFTFVDEMGVSRTCQCEESPYAHSISVIAADGTYRYDCTLDIFEAT